MKKSQIKKLPKYKIFFIAFGLIVLSMFIIKPSYARYVYNGIKNYYYESQSFYFNCDKLSENNAVFQLDNWDGVSPFPVTYTLNSIKNDLIASTGDIEYEVQEYECKSNYYLVTVAFDGYAIGDRIEETVYNNLLPEKKSKCKATADCTITKTEGTVDHTSHEDSFTVTITPNTTLVQGDYVELFVKVKSTSPYTKELTGTVRLNIGIPGISYEIVDKGGQPYLDFKITNTHDYYQAVYAFGNYDVGDTVSEEAYNNLSDEDKAKCTSALIRLTFNPNIILVDITSDFYDNAYSNTTQQINGKSYINGITFGVGPVTSTNIRFYKAIATNNYTYPYHSPISIIRFEVL